MVTSLRLLLECKAMYVLNEGMPFYHGQYEKGRLVVEFKVNFPENGFLSPDKSLCWKNSYLRGRK